MAELLQPFEFEFFRNGVVVATLAGALCGLVGVFVVLKGMSYIGHGLSHAIFGGFAASALLGVNFVLGAGVWGVASALLIGGVTRRRAIGADAAIGVITTASFALGLALFAIFGRRGDSFDAALFGSILGVDDSDVVAIVVVAVVVAAVVFFGYRPLLFTTFDPEVAEAIRAAHRPRRRPADARAGRVDPRHDAGPRRHARRRQPRHPGDRGPDAHQLVPPHAVRWPPRIGALTGFVGMNLSYHLDVQSGPTIVLVGATLFAVVFAASSTRRWQTPSV